MDKIKVYPVYGSLFDLFFGDGWEDWTRVSAKKNKLWIVAGAWRTPKDIGHIWNTLKPYIGD